MSNDKHRRARERSLDDLSDPLVDALPDETDEIGIQLTRPLRHRRRGGHPWTHSRLTEEVLSSKTITFLGFNKALARQIN